MNRSDRRKPRNEDFTSDLAQIESESHLESTPLPGAGVYIYRSIEERERRILERENSYQKEREIGEMRERERTGVFF